MTTVTAAISRQMSRVVAQHLRRTLTWDRGMELADHETVTANTGMNVYFADPRSPWQRGTNENTNGLLRQYLPKGSSMKHLTQHDLDAIADRLTRRPRKRLGFLAPSYAGHTIQVVRSGPSTGSHSREGSPSAQLPTAVSGT